MTRPRHAYSPARTFAMPLAIAVTTIAALILGLVTQHPAGDVLAAIVIAIPVAVSGRALFGRARPGKD